MLAHKRADLEGSPPIFSPTFGLDSHAAGLEEAVARYMHCVATFHHCHRLVQRQAFSEGKHREPKLKPAREIHINEEEKIK